MSNYLTSKTLIALLIVEKVMILNKYLNFLNIFSKKLVAELFY